MLNARCKGQYDEINRSLQEHAEKRVIRRNGPSFDGGLVLDGINGLPNERVIIFHDFQAQLHSPVRCSMMCNHNCLNGPIKSISGY